MYNANKIKEGFFGLVGWRQGTPAIATELTESESGLFFNSEHPLLTLDNLRSIAPKTGSFDDWLKAQTEDGILKAVQRFLSEKLAGRAAKGILDTKVMFAVPRKTDLIPFGSKMVGLELWPFPAFGVVVNVDRIGLCFTGECDVHVRLWHYSQLEPVEEFVFEYRRPYSVQWKKPTGDWRLYHDNSENIGAPWFLTYDQPEGVEAVTSRQKTVAYRKYIQVVPFITERRKEIWDSDENDLHEETGGMNVQLSLNTDFSSFLYDQRHQFQDLISKQVAINLLRSMAYNPEARINNASFRKAEILYELDGDSGSLKKSGLKYEYDRVLEGLLVDTEKLDNIVFSKKTQSIKYRTVCR